MRIQKHFEADTPTDTCANRREKSVTNAEQHPAAAAAAESTMYQCVELPVTKEQHVVQFLKLHHLHGGTVNVRNCQLDSVMVTDCIHCALAVAVAGRRATFPARSQVLHLPLPQHYL